MDNNTQLPASPVSEASQAPSPVSPRPHGKLPILILLVICVIVVSIFTGFMIGKNKTSNQQPDATSWETPQTNTDALPVQNPTVNWKPYVFEPLQLRLRVPPEFTVHTEEPNPGYDFTAYIQNYAYNAALPDQNAYQLYLIWQQTSAVTEEEFQHLKDDLEAGSIEDTTVAGYPAIKGQLKGERNRYVTHILWENTKISLFTADPTPTNKELTDQILSTFEFVDTNTLDTTTTWKSYTNSVLNYTIKYPQDWTLDASEAELPINEYNSQKIDISKDRYSLTILWPSAYGPGICLFDDQSKIGAPEMAGYCEGEYVEFVSDNTTQIHRRLVKPETRTDHVEWAVYTKNDRYFATVPPISYTAPLTYENDLIAVMDRILSTFDSTND